jgi:hypothetical protein
MHRINKFERVAPYDPTEPRSIQMRSELEPTGAIITEIRTANLTAFQCAKLLGATIAKLALLAEDEMKKLSTTMGDARPPEDDMDGLGELQAAHTTLVEIQQMFKLMHEMGDTIAASFQQVPKTL